MLIPHAHVHVPYFSLRETKTFLQWASGLFRKAVILAVGGHLNLDTHKMGTVERPSALQGDPGAVLAVVPCIHRHHPPRQAIWMAAREGGQGPRNIRIPVGFGHLISARACRYLLQRGLYVSGLNGGDVSVRQTTADEPPPRGRRGGRSAGKHIGHRSFFWGSLVALLAGK